jgi:hypothetical protein
MASPVTAAMAAHVPIWRIGAAVAMFSHRREGWEDGASIFGCRQLAGLHVHKSLCSTEAQVVWCVT